MLCSTSSVISSDKYSFTAHSLSSQKSSKSTFSNIKYKVVAEENEIITVVDVKYSWTTDSVELVPSKDVAALVPSGLDSSGIYIQPNTDTPSVIKAPVKKGDIIGEAVCIENNAIIAKSRIVARENIDKVNCLYSYGKIIDMWLGNK